MDTERRQCGEDTRVLSLPGRRGPRASGHLSDSLVLAPLALRQLDQGQGGHCRDICHTSTRPTPPRLPASRPVPPFSLVCRRPPHPALPAQGLGLGTDSTTFDSFVNIQRKKLCDGAWLQRHPVRPRGQQRYGRWRPRHCDPGSACQAGARQVPGFET